MFGSIRSTTTTPKNEKVNPHGFIHQITTIRQVENGKLFFQGGPQTENRYVAQRSLCPRFW
jgi:hypothetical protein